MGWLDFLRRRQKPGFERVTQVEVSARSRNGATVRALESSKKGAARSQSVAPPRRTERAAGSVGFAVVAPKNGATEQELREIGRRLQAWREENPQVGEVIGLEQLLAGQWPETDCGHFALPVPPYTEKVALVFVAREAANEATRLELKACLRGCAISMLVDPGYYRSINA